MVEKIIPKDDLFTGILSGEHDYLFGIINGTYRNTKAKFLVSVDETGEREVDCSPIAVFLELSDIDDCVIKDGSDILILFPDNSEPEDKIGLDESLPTSKDIIH